MPLLTPGINKSALKKNSTFCLGKKIIAKGNFAFHLVTFYKFDIIVWI